MRRRDPLLVFADDFGRHPSSCQHIVRRLVGQRDVLWVNTIGTRRPRLCAADLKRGVEKAGHWLAARRSNGQISPRPRAPHPPTVISPLMWPGFGNRVSRRLNRRLLSRAISRAVKQHLDRDPVVITTLPITADLVGRIPARRWVYYMVDDFAVWPGLDGPVLRSMEEELLGRVDAVAAVSEPLVRRAREAGHAPMLITHGVDLANWTRPDAVHLNAPALQRIAALPEPRAMFWGLIDGRLDRHVLGRLATKWPGSIVMIGPTQGDVSDLAAMPNVHLVGPLPGTHLPPAATLAHVLMMPYADLPVTRAMQPLKLKEYLATGRSVVCLDQPAARDWADCCDIVGPELFVSRILRRAVAGPAVSQVHARSRRLAGESWETKAAVLEMVIDEVAPAPGRRAA